MKIFIALMLAIWILLGVFFVPLSETYIESRTDGIVETLRDDSISFAASWAEALRKSDDLFGSRISNIILSKYALSETAIEYAIQKDSGNNLWCVCYFHDGSIIDATRVKTNNVLTISIEYYESCEKVFSAFKERSEREFG